jgi:hypothetical protein
MARDNPFPPSVRFVALWIPRPVRANAFASPDRCG